jgi:hypothetical protein
MKKSFLLAIFCALFLTATEARANIYGLLVLAENPALNLMQGTTLMLMSYEEGAYYRPYLEAYQFEGQVFRSGGASGAYDCYPVYPGLCAIVATQTELDFSNPDPSILEGDFYVDTVFVLQVAPGVYYGYDPAYYFGFGGGEYGPEFTFAPCWCGDYVVVVRIYLGTLGLLFPKPEFPYAVDESPTLAIAENDIPNTNQLRRIISGRGNVNIVGERFYPTLVPNPPSRPVTSVVWEIEGNIIEEFVVNYVGKDKRSDDQAKNPDLNTTGKVTDFNPNGRQVRMLWWDGSFQGSTYKIVARFNIFGRTYRTVPGTVVVYKPRVTLTAEYNSSPIVSDLYDPDDPDSFWTHLGSPIFGNNDGINFRMTEHVVPGGFQEGDYQWVQVVSSTTRRQLDPATYTFTSNGLDTTYPYFEIDNPDMAETEDSPGEPFLTTRLGVPAYRKHEITDTFSMYLMFRPRQRFDYETEWVPLKKVFWGWKAQSTATLDPQTGVMIGGTITGSDLDDITIADPIAYPEWTKNVLKGTINKRK